MGKKSAPKAPAAPDPAQTAAAQTAMNKETAIANANLNRINQYTPEGSLVFNQVGTNPDGTPKYESRQTYSPEQQQLYDQQLSIANQLNATAGQAVGRAQSAMSTPFDSSGFAKVQSNVDAGPITGEIGFKGPGVQYDYGGYGDIQTGIADTSGNIQNKLDYSSLGALPGTSDFNKYASEASNALYGQATSRLDPRFQQEQAQMAASLAAKGVTEGSAAYQKAMENFNRSKTDAYNQANFSAIQAGGTEAERLFGMALKGRQQGASEITSSGEFANKAQQQAYEQALGRGTFANTAQAQQYQQAADKAAFANEAQQQGYSQAASDAAFRNTAQGQRFNQGQSNAQLANQARQQQYQEAAYERNLPFQDIATLMGSGSPQAPQFADYASTNVANTDYSGLVQNNYNNQMQQYQQKMAQRNGALGSIFGLAGSAAMAFSDRRLKTNIKRIGETAAGIPTYTFNYIRSKVKQYGVIADEVFKIIPEAVSVDPSGYLMVDYRKVR